MKKLFTYALALPLMAAMMMVGCSREPMGDVASGGPDGRQWVEPDEMFVIKDNRLTADNIVGYSKMLARGLGVGTRGVVREVEGVVPILRDEIAAVSAVVGGDSVAGGGANGLAARGIVPFSVSESDTVMYAVNFKNDQGYMLLSSDSRVPMLAVIDEGGYNGVGDNPGFHMFLEMSEPYIAYSIAEYERTKDSIAALPSEDVTGNGPSSRIVGDTGGGGWGDSGNNGGYPPMPVPDRLITTSEHVTVCVREDVPKMTKTKWHQMTPYNDLYGDCSIHKQRLVAGCVTIAIAQLFAYHRWPAATIGPDAMRLNWSLLNATPLPNSGKVPVAKLVKNIADNIGLNKHPGDQEICATPVDIYNKLREFLPKYGYTKKTSWGERYLQYNSKDVQSSIYNGYPVIICGFMASGVGHCWLLDGMKIYGRKYETWEYWTSPSKGYDYQKLVGVRYGPQRECYIHCNWGGGTSDGYFAEGIWDMRRPVELTSSSSGIQRATTTGGYQYNVKVYTRIGPY